MGRDSVPLLSGEKIIMSEGWEGSRRDIPHDGYLDWLRSLREKGGIDRLPVELVHPHSFSRIAEATYIIAKIRGRAFLLIEGPEGSFSRCFEGHRIPDGSSVAVFCPLNGQNAQALREVFPHAKPSCVGMADLTFGTGDRLGLAGPAIVRLFRKYPLAPVLAQQSVRELNLMNRTYAEVLDSASWAVFREGYYRPWGADGDHLKDARWVRTALNDGYTMVTADVSDFLRGDFMACSSSEIERAYLSLDANYRKEIERLYLGRSFPLDCAERVAYSATDLQRIAVVYSSAVNYACELYREALRIRKEHEFDFELSIDETAFPTTAQAHLFVAQECRRKGMRLSSLAPRFVGELEKGIDYKGDVEEFTRSITVHASIARMNGYRLSIHSGSDKYSVFPSIGRETRGKFHIKISGTNWLEALRLMATKAPALFREHFAYAIHTFNSARAYYQISTDQRQISPIEELSDGALPSVIDQPAERQMLHISYGEVMRIPAHRIAVYSFLENNEQGYDECIIANLTKHLCALGVSPISTQRNHQEEKHQS
jgi:hypothetical protein